jgi:hypothetical protein
MPEGQLTFKTAGGNDLSYQAAGITNQLKYNGKELQEDHGLNLYDYGARI